MQTQQTTNKVPTAWLSAEGLKEIAQRQQEIKDRLRDLRHGAPTAMQVQAQQSK